MGKREKAFNMCGWSNTNKTSPKFTCYSITHTQHIKCIVYVQLIIYAVLFRSINLITFAIHIKWMAFEYSTKYSKQFDFFVKYVHFNLTTKYTFTTSISSLVLYISPSTLYKKVFTAYR